MSKARTLANFFSDSSTLSSIFSDGQLNVAEVSGAAPTSNPTFQNSITLDQEFNTLGTVQSVTLIAGEVSSKELNDYSTNLIESFDLFSGQLTLYFGGLFVDIEQELTAAVGTNITLALSVFGDPSQTGVYSIDSIANVNQEVDGGGGWLYDITLNVTHVSGLQISDETQGTFGTFDNQSTYVITSFLYQGGSPDVYVIETGVPVPLPNTLSTLTVGGVSQISSTITYTIENFARNSILLDGLFERLQFSNNGDGTYNCYINPGQDTPSTNIASVFTLGLEFSITEGYTTVSYDFRVEAVSGDNLTVTLLSFSDPAYPLDSVGSFWYWDPHSITLPQSVELHTLFQVYGPTSYSVLNDPSSYVSVGDTIQYKNRYSDITFSGADANSGFSISYDAINNTISYGGIPDSPILFENGNLYSVNSAQAAHASESNSITLGQSAYSDLDSGVVIGNNSYASGFNAVVIGTQAVTTGSYGVSIGTSAGSYNTNAVAIGRASGSGSGDRNVNINEGNLNGSTTSTFNNLVLFPGRRSSWNYFETNSSVASTNVVINSTNGSASVSTSTFSYFDLRQKLNMPVGTVARIKLEWIITEEDYTDLTNYYATGHMEFLYFSEATNCVVWLQSPTVDAVGTHASSSGLNFDIVPNTTYAGSVYLKLLTNGTDTLYKRVHLNWTAFFADPYI